MYNLGFSLLPKLKLFVFYDYHHSCNFGIRVGKHLFLFVIICQPENFNIWLQRNNAQRSNDKLSPSITNHISSKYLNSAVFVIITIAITPLQSAKCQPTSPFLLCYVQQAILFIPQNSQLMPFCCQNHATNAQWSNLGVHKDIKLLQFLSYRNGSYIKMG